MPNTRSHRRSASESRGIRPAALSLTANPLRHPALDMNDVTDVPSRVCVEITNAIIERPDMRTGEFFKLTAASNYDVNKSDAIIVISAVILESIGNSVGAKSMLNKSRTVSDFYKTLNLDNDKVRTSFCIMLFAIAPEFVKMIEFALKTSLERIQKLTTAPHADYKLIEATGELMRNGTITAAEHSSALDDIADIVVDTKNIQLSDSVQASPEDGIDIDDSVSRRGRPAVQQTDEAMTTKSLMRYIKNKPVHDPDTFYNKFPSARKPVEARTTVGKKGLGYSAAASAVSDSRTMTDFTDAMNSLLRGKTKSKRRTISNKDKLSYSEHIRQRNDSLVDNDLAPTLYESAQSTIDPFKFEVTRDDIANHTVKMPSDERSKVVTNSVLTTDQQALLDLL